MDKNDYILVIDSGNGGLYTLNLLEKALPKENFVFYKDVLNVPYGNKTKRQLEQITINNLNCLLKKYKIKVVVFACNTLSTIVLNQMSKIFKNVKFFGVVPPIKRAIKNKKNTLVLSTFATLKLGKIDKNYEHLSNVNFVGFKDLAKKIDDNVYNLNNLLDFLNENLKNYKNINNVVLGCTHFNLIKPQLRIVLNNDNLVFFEGSAITVKKVKRYLKVKNLLNGNNKKPTKIINCL